MKKLKWSIIIGILLGIGIKVYDFFNVGRFRCGIQKAEFCRWYEYIKDTLIWAIITAILIIIIVFGASHLIRLTKKYLKKEEKKENKKESKKKAEKKESKKKEDKPEEIVSSEPEEEIIKI